VKTTNETNLVKNEEIIKGFVNTYFTLNDNMARVFQSSVDLYTLIDLLIDKKIIQKKEFDKRKKIVEKQLIDSYKKTSIGIKLHDQAWLDKYALTNDAEIDCANRIHLCKGACCGFIYCLSLQDISEGIRWDLSKPFKSCIGDNGYCLYLREDDMRCSMYEKRPLGCRLYDCRNDQRVWLNFDKKIINPDLFTE
jgi:Fe-S-cluster containining protein